MRYLVVVLLGLMFADGLFAQCENGQCRPTPIRNSVATVVQAQPVRSVVRAMVQPKHVQGFAVGSLDADGALITSIGDSVSSSGIAQRKRSRQVITESVDKAVVDGLMDAGQADAIKKAIRSPRMLSRVEDLIAQQAKASGAYALPLDRNGEIVISAINWEGIADFIVRIAPIIFKLIEMFL
jgi:hypothetical protein